MHAVRPHWSRRAAELGRDAAAPMQCCGVPRRPLAGRSFPISSSHASQLSAEPSRLGRSGHTKSNTTGTRFICRRDGNMVRIFTRRGHDWTDRVPSIVDSVRSLRVSSATIDEAVVCDRRGLSDFDALRLALARRDAPQALLFAFDVLELDGQDLRRHPCEVRRRALARLLRKPQAPGRDKAELAHGRTGRPGDVPPRVDHGASFLSAATRPIAPGGDAVPGSKFKEPPRRRPSGGFWTLRTGR